MLHKCKCEFEPPYLGKALAHTQYCSSLTRHYLFSFSPDVHPSATEEGLTCFGAEFFLITGDFHCYEWEFFCSVEYNAGFKNRHLF